MASEETGRRVLFPYGMERHEDGSWYFFNRNYKHLGSKSTQWADWSEPDRRFNLKGLGASTLKALDSAGTGRGARIYFYDDATTPESSPENMKKYLEKLKILICLTE